MALTRSESRLGLATVEPGAMKHGDDSVAQLAARLAQESVALGKVELQVFAAEVRRRQHHVVRASLAFAVAVTLAVVGIASLAGAAILYLGRMWQDYAAGALATGVLLVLMTLAAGRMVLRATQKLTRAEGESRGARDRDERSASHGT